MAEVTITTPPAGDDPAHVAAMIAKADGLPPPAAAPAENPERPAWLPPEFNTPEEMAAAYAAAKKPAEAPAEEAAEVTPEEANEAAAKAVADAGLDMAALEAKVLDKGTLDASDYAALERAGITKAMADQYIEGQKALGEALTGRVYAHVGGEEKFNEIVQWATAGNLSPAEAKVFNRAVDQGDETTIKMALDGIAAKFAAAGGNAPNLLGGGRGGGASDVYESVQQMMADMRNPEYSRDPAFRAKVEAKLSRSSIL